MLVHFVRRRRDVPFHGMFWMFGAFIVLCGTTHLREVVVSYEPIYRLARLVKVATALVSLATAAALVPILPRALALRSPEELGREVAARRQAEEALRRANADLESRVRERTAELAQTNAALLAEVEERKRLEGELRLRADALADADRRKDEFLALLAHELRNPLAPIRNALQVVRLARDDRRAVGQATEMMERQVTQMVRLIDDLLDVSRITRGKVELRKERVDLAAVIRQAVETSRPNGSAMGHELGEGSHVQDDRLAVPPQGLNGLSEGSGVPRGGRLAGGRAGRRDEGPQGPRRGPGAGAVGGARGGGAEEERRRLRHEEGAAGRRHAGVAPAGADGQPAGADAAAGNDAAGRLQRGRLPRGVGRVGDSLSLRRELGDDSHVLQSRGLHDAPDPGAEAGNVVGGGDDSLGRLRETLKAAANQVNQQPLAGADCVVHVLSSFRRPRPASYLAADADVFESVRSGEALEPRFESANVLGGSDDFLRRLRHLAEAFAELE
jgi:hypothetical protein